MGKVVIKFPPPIFEVETKREGTILHWSPKEGLTTRKEPFKFTFPPTLLELEFDAKL